MRFVRKDRFLPALSREDGAVALEFVLLLPVIVLVILAMLEIGHLWYVHQTLNIASREGARAAVVYYPGSDRETWAADTAKAKVNDYLGPGGPVNWNSGDWSPPTVTITPGPSGLTGGTLTVRVQSTNALLVLNKIFTDITLAGETTMRFE